METLKNPFGKEIKTGKVITINDLDYNSQRGAESGCICPECKAPLIAKMGDERVWHFSHEGGKICNNNKIIVNSMYNIFEEELNIKGYFVFPEYFSREDSFDSGKMIVSKTQTRMSEGFCTGIIINNILLVTLKFKKGLNKKLISTDSSMSTVEINVESMPEDLTREKIGSFLIDNEAYKHWLFCKTATDSKRNHCYKCGKMYAESMLRKGRYGKIACLNCIERFRMNIADF